MKENCLVTLGVGKNYPRGVRRLKEQIAKQGVDCDFFGFTNFPEGIPTHQQIPYAFKYFLMKQYLDKGYRRVIWMDTSFVPLNNLQFLWDHLDKHGYLVYSNRHNLGPYTSDKCMEAFKVTRNDLFKLKSCASGIFGVHRDSELGVKILDDLLYYANNTQAYANPKVCSKDPRVKLHLPCQSTLSLVCHKLKATTWRDLENEAYTPSKYLPKGVKDRKLIEKYVPGNPKYKGKNYVLDRVYVKRDWY